MQEFINVDGRVLSISGVIEKQGVSRRKELFLLSRDGSVVRATLWEPFEKISIALNDRISLSKMQMSNYLGQTICSKPFSGVMNHRSTTEWVEDLSIAVKILGGINFDTITGLKSKITGLASVYGFVRGTFISFDLDIAYNACSLCKKSVKVEDKCQFCPNSSIILAIRLNSYIQFEDCVSKVTFFSDALSSWLGIDTSFCVKEDKEHILELLRKLVDKKICLKMKIDKKIWSIDGKERDIYQFCAQPPVFNII